MSEIKTRINTGDVVWWVHSSGRIHRGIVQGISLCEYQGALYCDIASPSFKVNRNPVVHYSEVFLSRKEAEGFREEYMKNRDEVFPRCMGCHYNRYIERNDGG